MCTPHRHKHSTKRWDALTLYFRDFLNTRAMLRRMAMQMLRADMGRGWRKLRAVYYRRLEAMRLREAQQKMAADMLSEDVAKTIVKVVEPNVQIAPTADDLKEVRDRVVTQIQCAFRSFRECRLREVGYPLGSAHRTGPQQAIFGKKMGIVYDALSVHQAAQLALEPDAREACSKIPDVLRSLKITYSKNGFESQTSLVHLSDCLSLLLFSDAAQSQPEDLDKASWMQFVHLGRISSAVIHSERLPGFDSRR